MLDEVISFSSYESLESDVSFILSILGPSPHDTRNPDPESYSTPCTEYEVSIDHKEDSYHPESKENSSKTDLCNIQRVRHHPSSQEIGDIFVGVHIIHQASSNFCMFDNFVSLIEPKKIDDTLIDAKWIREMQDKLHKFKRQNVWTLVPRPKGKKMLECIGCLEKDGIITINKETLVAQRFTQLEGLDYDTKICL